MKILDIVRDIMSQTKDMTAATFPERVTAVNNPIYNDIFSKLKIDWSEDGRFVIFKYKSFVTLFTGPADDEAGFIKAYDDFWNVHDGLFRQLRGLTIDLERMCIALYPYDKFFNINQCAESSEAEVRRRIENAVSVGCSDKLDGSLVSARYYGYGYNGNLVASSGSINPNSSEHCRLAKKLVEMNYPIKKMLRENPDKTFIFEMIDWSGPHVVAYGRDMLGLHLTGVRDMGTEKLWPYDEVVAIANKYGVLTTELFELDLDDMMSKLDTKKSSEAEGFVINIDGFFVKVKYNDFCLAHRIFSDTKSVNGIIKAYAEDQLDDMFSRCPSTQVPRIELVVGMVKDYEKRTHQQVTEWYEANKNLPLAEYCNKAIREVKNISGWAINMYKGRPNNYVKTKVGRYFRLHEMGYAKEEYMERLKKLPTPIVTY